MNKLRLAAKLPVLVLTIMVTMAYVSQGVKLLESAECMMLYTLRVNKHTLKLCVLLLLMCIDFILLLCLIFICNIGLLISVLSGDK